MRGGRRGGLGGGGGGGARAGHPPPRGAPGAFPGHKAVSSRSLGGDTPQRRALSTFLTYASASNFLRSPRSFMYRIFPNTYLSLPGHPLPALHRCSVPREGTAPNERSRKRRRNSKISFTCLAVTRAFTILPRGPKGSA